MHTETVTIYSYSELSEEAFCTAFGIEVTEYDGYVSYFVNGTQVGAADYRMAEGEETIYRSGLEIRAEKHDTRRISPDR